MNIYILEDNMDEIIILEEKIQQILTNNHLSAQIISFSNANKFLKEIKQNREACIYFIDIQLGTQKMNGLDVAVSIRNFDLFNPLIFVTTYSEMMPTAFSAQVEAFDFLLKDDPTGDFDQRLEGCIKSAKKKQHSKQEEVFKFKNKYSEFVINCSEILYFETFYKSHQISLVGKDTVFEFYSSLKEISKLNDRFIRCHTSYLVNIDNIFQIDKKNKEIIVVGGDRLPIAKGRYTTFSQDIWLKGKIAT